MNSIWDDDENISEYELLEEAQETEKLAEEYANQPTVVDADEEYLEEILEDASFDLDHEEANVVYNVRLRLEQTRLYEMIINHDIFAGVDVDERAVNIVQNELKHYIIKRLEALMGLRQPESKKEVNIVSSDFNPIEVEFLKALSYKGTRGESAKAYEAESTQEINPLPTTSRSTGLNPLPTTSRSTGLKSIANKPKPLIKKTIANKPPSKRKKKTTPVKKPAKDKIKSGMMERQLTKKEAENIARQDLQTQRAEGKKKPFHKMNAKEKAAEIKKVSSRHAPKAKPDNPQFPATLDENSLMNKYMTEQSVRGASTNKLGFNQILASALAAQKNNK